MVESVQQTGVPIATLSRWRDRALELEPDRNGLEPHKTDYAFILSEALIEAVARVRSELPRASFRDASIAMGILADKHLDYTLGRKGNTFNLDARQQTLMIPDGTTLDDIRALRDGIRHPGSDEGDIIDE